MKKNVSVFCRDKYLGRKIYLILSERYEVTRFDDSAMGKAVDADILIWNVDDAPLPLGADSYAVTMGDGGDLPLPFSEQMLLSAIEKKFSEEENAPLLLGEKCAHLYGKLIRFTDVEFALLSEMVNAGGEFVSRDELISAVWGDGTTRGILNVYIHYLREKLESCGEKIIISSRKSGYKIDKKYLTTGGEE